MEIEGTKLSIPEYWMTWYVKNIRKTDSKGKVKVHNWPSNNNGDVLTVPFHGSRITIIGESNNLSGYAWVSIKDKKGNILHRQYVDFYSKITDYTPQYVSRFYPKNDYGVEIEVSGENSVCRTKPGLGSVEQTVS